MTLSEANRFGIPYWPMPPSLRLVTAAVALAGALLPPCAAAQASPYLALDDPRVPLLEYLIQRGDIDDPSPMVRPVRRADALRVLRQADTAGAPALVVALRARFEEVPGG